MTCYRDFGVGWETRRSRTEPLVRPVAVAVEKHGLAGVPVVAALREHSSVSVDADNNRVIRYRETTARGIVNGIAVVTRRRAVWVRIASFTVPSASVAGPAEMAADPGLAWPRPQAHRPAAATGADKDASAELPKHAEVIEKLALW